MHGITIRLILQVWIILGLYSQVKEATVPLEEAGWVVYPVSSWSWNADRWGSKQKRRSVRLKKGQNRQCLAHTWHIPLLRSLVLWGLWQVSGRVGPDWVQLLPWVIWLLPEGRLQRWLWQIQRLVILGYAVLAFASLLQEMTAISGSVLGMSCVVCGGEGAFVQVSRLEDGSYQADICGHFTMQVAGDHPFRLRLLLIFVGLLQSGNDQRQSRRTRDGRTPFVRQEQLAAWTNTKQEHISLWIKYWLKGDWANLLSLKTAEVLTSELVERIVSVLATFPSWTGEQVYQHLRQQGLKVSQAQVEQASQQSGWQQLQVTLKERFDLQAGLHLRDEWLVAQLLCQVQELLAKVEAGSGLTPEERLAVSDLQTLSAQAGVVAQPPLPTQPWLQTMEGMLLGNWGQATDATMGCPYCGSTNIAPKSKKPRQKKFYNAEGLIQTVEVYRYYCRNSACSKKSFTHLPAGLVRYSPYRTQVHLLAIQMYAWGYSTYRRTGTALGIYSMTAYRWVSALGHDLLPVAALFGLLKSSGVVGVDEKYVLVPKNDKPQGDMRRWMYVYLAVDAWTYDLLHIAIYPNNNDDSAKAFLLALRAKGYHPQVIVTDLRQDYGPVIAQIFPAAQHHECIFHALQNVQKHIKDVYGLHYAENHPEAELLKQQIYTIFDTSSRPQAEERYRHVLILKESYLIATPSSSVIFDFLDHHWPSLVNAIGSDLIPTTNNSTELVIRRFDQHYQNFCGFQSIDSAHTYLAVFEKLYRFSPFSQDAQPRIRGMSPLQLAGYDVSQVPMTAICYGLSVDWPTQVNLVPN